MNKGRIYFIVVSVILAALLGFTIYSFYTEQYGAKKVNAVISLFTNTDSISYKEIFYNVNRDEILVTGIEVGMKTGGKVTLESLLMDTVYAENTHNLTATGFKYVTNDRFGSVITAEEVRLTQFNMVSLVDFVIRVQNSSRHVFFPTWMTGQFDMQQLDATNLTYTRDDGSWIMIEEFGWQGPLTGGESPDKLNFTLKNATAGADKFAKLLGKERLAIPSATYQRVYDANKGIFSEKLEYVVVKDLFTFTLEYELSNFHMDEFLSTYYEGKSLRKKIVEDTFIDYGTLIISGTGFVDTVSDILRDVIMMDGKTFARIWLDRELPKRMAGITNIAFVSELLTQYIDNPETLKVTIRPANPVPLRELEYDNKTHFNDLNIMLYVNLQPPVEIRMEQEDALEYK